MFKIGDRVKVVDDVDDLGLLGKTGDVRFAIHPKYQVKIGKEDHIFWEHELQLIPMSLASDEPPMEPQTIIETMRSMVPQEVRDAMKEERGLRHDAGKPEIHQVPSSLIIAVAEVLKYGESKYAKGNWKKGMDWVKPYDCLMRHMFKWLAGEEKDEESGLSHLYHAAANIAMLIEYKDTCPELDNREF